VARWADVAAEEPELAARARGCFDGHVHKLLATLRRDGSPRISGIELVFAEGDVWFGSMRDAVKARDLQRDPRYAVHSGSDDPPAWGGDAKIAGLAEEVFEQAVLDRVMEQASPEAREAGHRIESMHLFRLGLDELVWTGIDEAREKLLVEWWRPGAGRRLIAC
jgi:general stress protein 26